MEAISGPGSEAVAMPRWSLFLFGGFRLRNAAGENITLAGKRERVLLAYLALSSNRPQSRRKLAALLWGDATDETALDNLRTCLWGLRKALSDADRRSILTEGEEIVLDTDMFEVDAWTFRRLGMKSERQDLEIAAGLYSGDFLEGLSIDSEDFESWRRAEAISYRDQAIDVLTRLMAQLSDSGEMNGAIQTGQRILSLDPVHEVAVCQMMRLYAQIGRRGAAVQLYLSFVDTLRTELNVEPEPEMRRAFAELSRSYPESALLGSYPDLDAKEPAVATNVPAQVKALDRSAKHRYSAALWSQVFRSRHGLIFLAAVLVALVALLSYPPFVVSPRTGAQGAGVAAEHAAAANPAKAISIAVLPFLNLSGDAGQEFFSDGMTEEITATLAKIPDLRIVARTSAFQFKGENKDLRGVGRALNATHLIEGSVRKEGNRVRITAELIEAATGVHVWTESYDRQLSDIFTTQEEMARTIVGALMAPLGLSPGEHLISNRGIDPASYQKYLRAKAVVRGRSGARGLYAISEASTLLEQVIANNSDYAPAWALLARVYELTPSFELNPGYQFVSNTIEVRRDVARSLSKAEAAARRAIQLDSGNADAYLALGSVQQRRGKLVLAEELFSRALQLDPNNPDVLNQYSALLAEVGRTEEALSLQRQLYALEPFVPIYNTSVARFLWLTGQNKAALEMFKALPAQGREANFARIYASMNRYEEAADFLVEASAVPNALPWMDAAARVLRTAPAKAPAPEALPRLGLTESYIYAYVGAPERVLEPYEDVAETGYAANVYIAYVALLWHPAYASVRRTKRFEIFAREIGLVEYWRARGWPASCKPSRTDEFSCV